VVRNFVNQTLEENPNAWVLVAGDLNDFPFGEPGEGEDHPLAILEGKGEEVRLANLVFKEEEHQTFTFIFQGNSQVLDHLLASPAFSGHIVGVDILHFNASLPDTWSAAADTPLRSSDHDPVELRLRLKQ
jgi:predicted extracellular nuclease